jgi:hypothetical protein
VRALRFLLAPHLYRIFCEPALHLHGAGGQQRFAGYASNMIVAYFAGFARASLHPDSKWEISHRIVHELLPQLGEFVSLHVLEGGFHGSGNWSTPTMLLLRRFSKKVSGIILFPVLADDASCAEITDQ